MTTKKANKEFICGRYKVKHQKFSLSYFGLNEQNDRLPHSVREHTRFAIMKNGKKKMDNNTLHLVVRWFEMNCFLFLQFVVWFRFFQRIAKIGMLFSLLHFYVHIDRFSDQHTVNSRVWARVQNSWLLVGEILRKWPMCVFFLFRSTDWLQWLMFGSLNFACVLSFCLVYVYFYI